MARYAIALGFAVKPRTILVEGTTDVEVMNMASASEREKSGVQLVGADLAIVAAGEKDRGGTKGVIRELIALRGMARTALLPNGLPRYRFYALFDNDSAGQHAVKAAHAIDSSLLEFRDVYRLWPVMPRAGNLDQATVQRAFQKANEPHKGLKWELEDMLSSAFMSAFLDEFPKGLINSSTIGGKSHYELTADGKAKYHRFIRNHAVREDFSPLIEAIKTLRYCLNLPPDGI